eukprot:1244790-Pyramimonas_sp.AAC.1
MCRAKKPSGRKERLKRRSSIHGSTAGGRKDCAPRPSTERLTVTPCTVHIPDGKKQSNCVE